MAMGGDEDNVILKVDNVSLNFGGLVALDGVSLNLKKQEILAIIGPNGAGKTCVLNCSSGYYHPRKGTIYCQERNITRLAPHQIANLGIGRTFQNLELFTGLSTIDNLMAARHQYLKPGVVESAIYFGRAQRKEVKHREVVEDIIDFLEMEAIRKTVVGALPYGLRKRVALGRALALQPKVLLLDEPMSGMNVEEKEDMARFIIDIYEERGIPIALVEHDMGVVMDIADRIVVLDFGRKIAEGSPEQVSGNPEVIKAYLGEEYAPLAK